MDDTYREKLRDQARAYLFYLTQLSPDEQSAIWILLPRGGRKTIRLLEYIKEGPVSYDELCRECGYRSQHSVSQKLNALKEGGFPLSLESDKAWGHYGKQGRPRRVTYLNRSSNIGRKSVK